MAPRNEKWNQLSTVFFNWLYEPMDVPIPESCVPYINHKILISAFSKEPKINIILNKLLNTTYLYNIDIIELANFIKQVIHDNHINENKIWWYSNLEFREKDVNKKIYKLLKPHERDLLGDMVEQGMIDESLNPFMEKKKKKKTKAELAESLLVKEPEVTVVNENALEELRQYYINNKTVNINCKNCTLNQNQIVTFDSNDKTLSNIHVMFIAEAPGETETQQGVPLIGKAGQLLRKYINNYLGDLNFFMTNVCLCRPEDNRTPTEFEMKCCSINLDEVINAVKPKLIISLGSTSMSRLGINDGVMKARGIHKYKHYNVFSTMHPSGVIRGGKYFIYDEDFKQISDICNTYREIQHNIVNSDSSEYEVSTVSKVNQLRNIMANNFIGIKLPSIYYDYFLVDVQFLKDKYKVLYIFRDTKGNRIYAETDSNIYCFYTEGIKTHYEEVNKLSYQPNLKYSIREAYKDGRTYFESDVYPDNRHCIDFFLNKDNSSNNDYRLKILYTDIEVYSKTGAFPDITVAEHPVQLITNHMNGKTVCLVLNDEIPGFEYKNTELIYFDNERDLLLENARIWRESDIDVITAWNAPFDIGYVYHRMINLGLDPRLLSPLGYTLDIDAMKEKMLIPGYIAYDMIQGYKWLTIDNKKESYTLSYISEIELGHAKSHKGGQFNELWDTDKEESIRYNIDDVVDNILELDKKLLIVSFMNEMRISASCSWESLNSTSRIVDSMLIRMNRVKGLALRTKSDFKTKDENIGAYVYNPTEGTHDNVYIVDFSKQYPSSIQTLNIDPTTLVAIFDNKNDVINYLSNYEMNYTMVFNPVYNPTYYNMTLSDVKSYIKDNNLMVGFGGGIFCKHQQKKSILYSSIDELTKQRSSYKKLYKEKKDEIYKSKERSVKILTNSIYGILGQSGNRFNITYLVNNITLTGRYINKLCALSANYLLLERKNNITFEEFIKNVLSLFLTKYWNTDIDEPFIIYGDTDSIFMKIADMAYASWKEAKARGDEILKVLNEVIIKQYIPAILNIDPNEVKWLLDYQGITKARFTDVKKRYVLKYYDGEYSGIVTKGFETRKSDYPIYAKKNLIQLIDMVMNDVPVDKIQEFVDNVTTEYINKVKTFSDDVGRPVEWKKDIDSYEKVPFHIIGMIFWNKCILDSFRRGMKGFCFKVNYNNNMPQVARNILNDIAKQYNIKSSESMSWLVIPEGMQDKIPSWIEVDTKYMLDYAWTSKSDALVPKQKTLSFSDFDF